MEGKQDPDNQDENCSFSEPDNEHGLRRRQVFVLRAGKLHLQDNGVEQFELSLEKRVRKLMTAA